MDIKLARLFDLGIAYDPRGIFRPEYVAAGARPTQEGPWRIYRGFRDNETRCTNPVRDGMDMRRAA